MIYSDILKHHLGGDLSNKTLASVANVSEDYVGQYFKMLTGINPSRLHRVSTNGKGGKPVADYQEKHSRYW